MLMGITRAIDPLFIKAKDKIAEVCNPLKEIRSKVTSEVLKKRMFYECDGYQSESLIERGYKGSGI